MSQPHIIILCIRVEAGIPQTKVKHFAAGKYNVFVSHMHYSISNWHLNDTLNIPFVV